MKKLSINVLVLLLSLFLIPRINAQEISHNITHEISKKAYKGELYDYFINTEKNQIELAYKLKETDKKLVMETYYFKLDDLSFISSKEEEFEKERVKYKRIKGEKKNNDPVKLLKITTNVLNGKLKLHKGYVSYSYAGRVRIDHFIEEWTKEVSTSQGDKFIYMSHQVEQPDLDVTGVFAVLGRISIGVGNASIIGMEKTKPYYSKYAFTIYDAHTLNEKLYKTIDLGYSYVPMSIKFLPNGDYGIAFKPLSTTNVGKLKDKDKFKQDPENNFKYIQVNSKGEKVVDVNFKLPIVEAKGNYSIQIIPTDKSGEIILLGMYNKDMFGAAIQINPKWITVQNTGESINMYRAKKATGFVMKIANNKIELQKEFSLDGLVSNLQLTKGTKGVENPMQGFKPLNVTTDSEGNVLIGGLNKEHTILQIDKDGNFTSYVDASNQDLVIYNQFIKNAKDELFWVNTDQAKVKGDGTPSDIEKAQNKRTAVISKINSQGKKIEKTIALNPDGIYLDIAEPIKVINEDELLILGHGKKKEISLSKLILN